MTATSELMVVAISAVVGVVIGVLIGILITTRRTTGWANASASETEEEYSTITARSLREALEQLEIGVMITAADGATRYRNPAAAQYRDTHAGLIIDDHLSKVLAGARRDGTARELVGLHGAPKIWVSLVAIALPDDGAVVTLQDISERIRTDAMRSDFVTNVSHELKTPVGAIAVLAETLIDETDPQVARALCCRVVEEAHRAARTIDDLLKLSEIESNEPRTATVDLDAIVQSAINRSRVAAADRRVEIHSITTQHRIAITGDEHQLSAAIGNLVENAVKYSDDGGAVDVRTSTDDRTVEVAVSDQGIGIPARDLDRIFERFYRVDRARSRKTGGAGLGLAIARHAATNHGGEILVSSREGEGSTFVLRLPAVRPVDQSPGAGHDDPENERGGNNE